MLLKQKERKEYLEKKLSKYLSHSGLDPESLVLVGEPEPSSG